MVYYTVYRITNKVNGRFYVGQHVTSNLDDDYLGSGRLIKRAVKKYGPENFEKEILFLCENLEDMNRIEGEIVNESFVADSRTYNLTVGGKGGGYHFINQNGLGMSSEKGKRMNDIYLSSTTPEQRSDVSRRASITSKERGSGLYDPNIRARVNQSLREYWTGREHTSQTKEKMRQAKLGLYEGINNPQFGTMWITNGTENRKIKRSDEVPEGWCPGRIIKVK